MSSDAWDRGLQICRRAENAEKMNKLGKAQDLYSEGLEILLVAIQQTSNDRVRKQRRQIAVKYMDHAERLKAHLTGSSPPPIASHRPCARHSARRAATNPAPASTSSAAARARHSRKNSAQGGVGNEYLKRIESEILSEKPNVKFDDIAGLQPVKDALYETVILPSQRPDVFTGLRAPPKGILVFGPPGNGKTMVAKAVATEANCTFFNISASSLTSKYVGEGEKMVRALFQLARERQPAIVFIDEIDSLLTTRGQNENDAARRLKTEFLVQFDGVSSDAEDRVLVMGATNLPQELDEAVLRRFPKKFLIPLPDEITRGFLVQHLLKKSNFRHRLSKRDFQQIVQWTEGYSGSDLAALTKDATMGPVRDAGDAIKRSNFQANDLPPISLKHFQQSLDIVRPSVPPESLREMLQWNEAYGSAMHQSVQQQQQNRAQIRRAHSAAPQNRVVHSPAPAQLQQEGQSSAPPPPQVLRTNSQSAAHSNGVRQPRNKPAVEAAPLQEEPSFFQRIFG